MTEKPLAFTPHDHSACSCDILARADAICGEDGLRMTPVRRRALEILLESHKALGAYEVLERLAADGFGHQPPVAYRALDFLVENGFAHRVRRLNAFAACMHPGTPHSPIFFICRECDSVAEAPVSDARAEIEAAADIIGFQVERVNLEAVGLCPGCAPECAPGCAS